MATIGSATSSSYENTSRRSYISAAPFQDDIWAYTTSIDPTNYVTTGTLTKLSAVPGSGANSVTCPAYRVVRETGRKLYPASNPGVATYLVEVFDSVSFLRGYINPNSPIFAAFNSDKPAFLEAPYDANRDVSGGSYNTGAFTGVDNWGQSILTHGNIIMDGYIDALGQVRSSQQNTATVANTATYAADIITAQTYYLTFSGATGTINATNINIGDRATFVIKCTNGGGSTVTFGTGFLKSATLALALNETKSVTFYGVYTGSTTQMVEVSRTGALA